MHHLSISCRNCRWAHPPTPSVVSRASVGCARLASLRRLSVAACSTAAPTKEFHAPAISASRLSRTCHQGRRRGFIRETQRSGAATPSCNSCGIATLCFARPFKIHVSKCGIYSFDAPLSCTRFGGLNNPLVLRWVQKWNPECVRFILATAVRWAVQ